MADLEWRVEDEYDVVVAGGGGGGLMAAVEAAEHGAKVLLVEKQPDLGGATGMAIGSITASGTPLQAAAGIRDDVEAHFRDYLKLVPPDRKPEDYDLGLSRLLVELAPQALARLMELGCEFSGPHPEPPHTVYRMHNVVPGPVSYIETLSRAAVERGATLRRETTIQDLERGRDGAVSGLAVRHLPDGRLQRVRVRKGVVLATGYFSANDELARAHGRTPEVSAVDALLTFATGDGIQAATEIGAATEGMGGGSPSFRTVRPPHANPDEHLFKEGAVLVNKLGRRFTNEVLLPFLATSRQPDGVAFVVFDSRLASRVATAAEDSPLSRDGWYRNSKLFMATFPGIAYAYLDDLRRKTDYLFEADSLAGLAEQIHVSATDFEDDLQQLSRAASGVADDVFGRDPVGPGVSEPPYYAMGPIKSILMASEGGLKVDRDMHVLDEEGQVVPHLYAAGANGMSGTLVAGHGHALSWAFGTGRIAGASAATETPVA